jgi:predicted nucleotidyltransferase
MMVKDIRNVAGRVFAKRPEVSVAYVFGSFLKSKIFNDIDIGLLLEDHFQPDALYEARLAGQFEKELEEPFDIRILNDRPLRFLFYILQDAKLVYVRDEKHRIRFEQRVLTQYIDFKPYHDLFEEHRRVQYVNR